MSLNESTTKLRAELKRLICECMAHDGASLAQKAFRIANEFEERLVGEAYIHQLVAQAERAFHGISHHHAKQRNIAPTPARLDLLVPWVEAEAYRWSDERLWNAHHLWSSIREAQHKPADLDVSKGIAIDTALLMAVFASCMTDEIRKERSGLTGWRRWILLISPKEVDSGWLRALKNVAAFIPPILTFKGLCQY